jgi:putative Mn2+ efflux pump MntP
VVTRREFTVNTGRFLLAGTVAASLPLNGCNWVQFLIDYIPVINGGISTIESFFGAALPLGITAILDGIKAALADIGTAATDYEAAPPASKATFLQKIEVFLQGIVSGFQAVLDNFGASSPVPAIVLGVINLVISTLGWLVGKFASKAPSYAIRYSNGQPVLVTLIAPVRLTYRANTTSNSQNQSMVIAPVERKPEQFKSAINSLMAANGRPDIQLPH